MPQPWFPDQNNSRAVLIGASTFPSIDLPDLPAVAHNLDALEQVLTDPQHGVIGDCIVLANHDVTDAKIAVAVAEAASEATDLLLVYYAGHGVLDDDGRLHLARPDTNMDHVSWTSVSVDLLKRDLSQARARARVLVLDCCFSGRAIAAMADSRSLVAGQLDLSGTYTLTSTTATTPSHAPPGKQYTSFTHALLGALAQPDPLTLDDIYLRITSELDSLGLPRPQHNATNNAATLALTRGPVVPSTKQLEPKKPLSAPEPIAQRRFTAMPSKGYRVGMRTGWGLIGIGILSTVAAEVGSPGGQFADAVILITAFLLLPLYALYLLLPIAEGHLEIDRQSMTIQRPLWRQTQVSWSTIHKIRVLKVNRSRRRSPHCKIEIELRDPPDHQLENPFTPVQDRDRPTYQFGEVNIASDVLAAVVRQTVGSSTLVEVPQPSDR